MIICMGYRSVFIRLSVLVHQKQRDHKNADTDIFTTNFYAWTLNHSSYPWCLRSPGEGRCSKQGVEHRPDQGYLGHSSLSALVVQRPLLPSSLLRSSESSHWHEEQSILQLHHHRQLHYCIHWCH